MSAATRVRFSRSLSAAIWEQCRPNNYLSTIVNPCEVSTVKLSRMKRPGSETYNCMVVDFLYLENRWEFKSVLVCIKDYARRLGCEQIQLNDMAYIVVPNQVGMRPRLFVLFALRGKVHSIYESVFGPSNELLQPKVHEWVHVISTKATAQWMKLTYKKTHPMAIQYLEELQKEKNISDNAPIGSIFALRVSDYRELYLLDVIGSVSLARKEYDIVLQALQDLSSEFVQLTFNITED